MNQTRLPDPVAIDGPAASGKTTLGEALAHEFGYRFLDTGLMYRAVAFAANRASVPATPTAAAKLLKTLDLRLRSDGGAHVLLGDEDVTPFLRDDVVERTVSAYAAIPAVRTAMVGIQRAFADEGMAVLAGRDIGTVVLPDAPLKFYLQASDEARARRRSAQARDWGQDQHHDDAHRHITSRDVVDRSRETSPMRPAADAIVVDTTNMELPELIRFATGRVRCWAG